KPDSCDYPDYAIPVAEYVSKGVAERGILLCGTGIGMSIVANKFRNVRAAVCYSDETAALASKHNNANIMCISGRFFPTDQIIKFIKIWLETPFEGESGGERHQRRLDKIKHFEERFIKKLRGG
ncbi:MAG: RpiB/LacA/LacB family sugar-phosphate isomerase, partial [Elusimicrobiota bacterium]|nr:RpiB/LacA/LacB family sugar-phosphate isomerase [Elusimicrobiota bacterium]